MDILVYLIPIALLLGGVALAAFLWTLRSGQYDDMEGAANRILFDDDERLPSTRDETQKNNHIKETGEKT